MIRIRELQRTQGVAVGPGEAFGFFADTRNLELITPPWLHFRVRSERDARLREGSRIAYRLRLHGVPIRWLTEIERWEPGVCFIDRQVRGPYALWHHTHGFEALPGGGTLLRDRVRYAIGYGPLGELAHRALVARDLKAIFDFRAVEIERRFGTT